MAISTSSVATVERDSTLSKTPIPSLALVFPTVVAVSRIKGMAVIGLESKQTLRLQSKMQGLLSEISLHQALVQGDKVQVVEIDMIKLHKYRPI